MRSKFILILFLITLSFLSAQQSGSISGKVFSDENIVLPNANIFVTETGFGTITDQNGNYNIKLSPGKYKIRVSYIGYISEFLDIDITSSGKHVEHNFVLRKDNIQQNEVVVFGAREELTVSAQQLLDIDIKNMPTVYSDVLKTIKLLPGVTSNNEMSSSYNVRGGNFDENLIYINGYEVFRPFLLRMGVEENQSIINPDLVSDLQFYGGGYPARFGDRMSSALEITYKKPTDDSYKGTLRLSLLNAGLSVLKKYGDFDISAGVRFAYPGQFLKGLQTKGNFDPSFIDFQLITQYNISSSSNLELFLIQSHNKFNLTPKDWDATFRGFDRDDFRAIKINYTGDKKYSFDNGLYALRYKYFNSKDFMFSLAFANYRTKEYENVNLMGEVLYNEDARDDFILSYNFLKLKFDVKDNYVKLDSKEIILNVQKKLTNHFIHAGINLKYFKIDNQISELYSEFGDSLVLNTPIDIFSQKQYKYYQISGFVQDIYTINDQLQLNAGVRASYYNYNEEFLVNPRASLHYYMDSTTTFRFATGLYFQQPFYYELKSIPDNIKLNSQKSLHIIAGMEKKLFGFIEWDAEVFYKHLFNAYSYTIDELNLIYNPTALLTGNSFGFDMVFKGELIPGTRNWISYSYLNSKEKPKNSDVAFRRRLLDQSHTVQIFFQDSGRKTKNLKAHARIMFGTGFLYNLREITTDPITNNQEVAINFDKTKEFNAFVRIDLGLTYTTKIFNKYKLTATMELLNLFDNLNVLTHTWIHVVPEYKFPFAVDNLLSRRNLNIGVQIEM